MAAWACENRLAYAGRHHLLAMPALGMLADGATVAIGWLKVCCVLRVPVYSRSHDTVHLNALQECMGPDRDKCLFGLEWSG